MTSITIRKYDDKIQVAIDNADMAAFAAVNYADIVAAARQIRTAPAKFITYKPGVVIVKMPEDLPVYFVEFLMEEEELKARYRGVKPHTYVNTEPYKGCRECGFGPGAIFHNTFEVERFKRESANDLDNGHDRAPS